MVNGLNLSYSSKLESKSQEFSSKFLESDFKTGFSDQKSKIKCLYKILLDTPKFDGEYSGIDRFLEAGCLMFGMHYGLILRRLSDQVAEVAGVVDLAADDDTFYIGQHLAIEGTPSLDLFTHEQIKAYKNASSTGVYPQSFAYNGVDVSEYLGASVAPSSLEPLVVCFFSSVPKDVDWLPEDNETIGLLAEGVACMIDIQKSQAQRKMTDQAMLALGSVKTLDEYLQQARLPEVYGVPARVVEVLQKRIGHAPLSIGHVAEELNLSKRTLQRRLQQQEISFAELRDQVRFHYSIDYLIKQHLSIDSISASLDFSDRTSFTNAFKRWTGLSPSTFRKLFRDYV